MDLSGLDHTVRSVVREMNLLPGIKTYESCCGHGRYPYKVYFTWDFISSGMEKLARITSMNYSKFSENWSVVLDYKDTEPTLCFLLCGKEEEAEDFAKELANMAKEASDV